MKPCLKYKKRIAWMALEALEEPEAGRLRDHLQSCAGCRAYFEELAQIKVKLTAAGTDPQETRSSEAFHRKLVARMEKEKPQSAVGDLLSGIRAWRAAIPLAGAAAVIVGILWAVQEQSHQPAPPRPVGPVVSKGKINGDLPPTIANYDMVANQSLDKLDDLLNRQGNRNPQRGPIYNASARFLAGMLD
jgi:hypothetical protein